MSVQFHLALSNADGITGNLGTFSVEHPFLSVWLQFLYFAFMYMARFFRNFSRFTRALIRKTRGPILSCVGHKPPVYFTPELVSKFSVILSAGPRQVERRPKELTPTTPRISEHGGTELVTLK